MEPSALPANARVTVECTDPAGLFSTFAPLLEKHLPLRNLHWKSPVRPLRSIDSLHVALQVAKHGQAEAAINGRRHQIPGLRQTPYLKVYLLRCDDNETYKTICRKQIREWVKSNTFGKSSSNSQEAYDAFEWLIVHVVLPDTPAASQARTSKHTSLGTTDSTDSIAGKSKWPGKGSSTVYEKIRADFDSSSKSPVDRVAQIRLSKPSAAQHIAATVLGPSEVESQWQELIETLKVSILASFNLRVSRYEEDIRERDSQRNLPGWNFCTFFILKEGLAQGFESVGLVEDALAGYDELSLGLDVVVREQALGDSAEHDGTFLTFSDDLKGKIRTVLEQSQATAGDRESINGSAAHNKAIQSDHSAFPLDIKTKPYRQLILSNKISVFDFRCYIFIRQAELLLRLAKVNSRTVAATEDKRKASDNVQAKYCPVLAQLCKRASEFINLGARTLRYELYQAWGGHDSQDLKHMAFQESIIDDVVLSWTYCAALQILEQTTSSALVIPEKSLRNIDRSQSEVPDHRSPNHRRNASPGGLRSESETRARPSSQDLFSPDSYSSDRSPSQSRVEADSKQSSQLASKTTAIEELALQRADLYLLARTVLDAIGKKRKWLPDINRLGRIYCKAINTDSNLGVVCSGDAKESEFPSEVQEQPRLIFNTLEPGQLRSASKSQESFNELYELLTEQIRGHFQAAQKVKSAERALLDMAFLNFHIGEYESAAFYFIHTSASLHATEWSYLDGLCLELHAACLKQLGHESEYFHSLIKLMSRYAADQPPTDNPIARAKIVATYVDDLCSSSRKSEFAMTAKMEDVFAVTRFEPFIRQLDGKDGFCLAMSLRTLLGTHITLLDGVNMVLSPSRESHLPSLHLQQLGPIRIEGDSVEVLLSCNVTLLGWYRVHSVNFVVGNISFVQNFGLDRGLNEPTPLRRSRDRPDFSKEILIYPALRSLDVNALLAPKLELPHPRSLLLRLRSHRNDIRHSTLHLRAATAGLRLHLHEAVLFGEDEEQNKIFLKSTENGGISLPSCPPNSVYQISVPYGLEASDTAILSAKSEVVYTTETGDFVHMSTISINTILPVSVNVQDIFKDTKLFSRFTISPATLVPIRVEACYVRSSDEMTVESGIEEFEPMDIFPKQPASLVCKFMQTGMRSKSSSQNAYALVVELYRMDECISSTVESQFVGDVASGDQANLTRLLTPHLVDSLRARWTEQDLEIACLLQEIEIWPFDAIGWPSVLTGLPESTRTQTERWLRAWHDNHASLDLHHSNAPRRQITIPVDLPTPKIVISVTLILRDGNGSKTPVAVGELLIAELKITHTDSWAKHQSDSKDVGGPTPEVSYEVIAPAEMWLVGGVRRGNFTTDSGDQRYPVLLLPQRAGHLLLPSVEIKCSIADNSTTPAKRADVAIEVDNRTQATGVFVVADLRETTVNLDSETAGRSNWLVGSKRGIDPD